MYLYIYECRVKKCCIFHSIYFSCVVRLNGNACKLMRRAQTKRWWNFKDAFEDRGERQDKCTTIASSHQYVYVYMQWVSAGWDNDKDGRRKLELPGAIGKYCASSNNISTKLQHFGISFMLRAHQLMLALFIYITTSTTLKTQFCKPIVTVTDYIQIKYICAHITYAHNITNVQFMEGICMIA